MTKFYIIGSLIGAILTIALIIGLIKLGMTLLAYVIISLTVIGSVATTIILVYIVLTLLKRKSN